MEKQNIDWSLYLCTDRRLMSSSTIEENVECALKGGVTAVQLREKECSSREFLELALRVKGLTSRYGVPLIINDRVDIALAAGADGVHVGQDDLPCRTVRQIAGPDMLIGVSVSALDEAIRAEQDGADYLGVGAMFPTGTKTDAEVITLDLLKEIRKAVSIPIVIIGGINMNTAPQFKGLGIDGIAVVSAIVAQPDVEAAARGLLELWKA
ncbi:MAG: thiamine phosphate synthase [Bacteroidetes bacterium]|uniref:Thiamine-phosphate synthase n=1 Tax=Candidatus Cryptobacteroides merdavium TaxID=2840769 RepID=A0A9D9H7P6_9BACT|nr:thiamine phosphate synthase [Candidatus Cryptobacteroides merdavium]